MNMLHGHISPLASYERRSVFFSRSSIHNMKALVTGSGGLIGSECVRLLAHEGWKVIGVDNDMRRQFFGDQGTTLPVIHDLVRSVPSYQHYNLDIRNRQAIRDIFKSERPDFVIHTAAQPSHDKAASIPYDDFDVNAVGTMNLLVAARDFCKDSPFCFTSTNKVYGDRPNDLELVELEKRYDYADGRLGIDEAMSIDNCLHSVFGASKVAADVMCQEFGRYFQMPIGVFRGGCLTGPQHAGVELHGYLSILLTVQSPDANTLSTGTRANRFATRFTAMTWLSSFSTFFLSLALARYSISAVVEIMPFLFWRLSIFLLISDFISITGTRMRIE